MPEPLSEQEFKLRSDEALTSLYNALAQASDGHDFETDYGGALTIEFETPPAKFVVSPNSPVRQIWISAHSKSFKLDWDSGKSAFVLPETKQTLKEVVQSAVSKQLGEDVEL
jgi:iron donor protein CyaY